MFAAGSAFGLRYAPYGCLYRRLAAALLNAVFGFCLGCEVYLLIRRVRPGGAVLVPAHADKED